MTAETWAIILVPIGLTAVLIPAVKWLISDWHKKGKELQKLKEKQVSDTMMDLKEEVKRVLGQMLVLQTDIRHYAARIKSNEKMINELCDKIRTNVSENKNISRNIQQDLKEIVRSEIIKLAKDAVLIRDKKEGNGA